MANLSDQDAAEGGEIRGAEGVSDEEAMHPEDIQCPKCLYQLRWIASERCPECGWVIDVAYARHFFTQHESGRFEFVHSQNAVRAFVRDWFNCAVRPWRFWREYPNDLRPSPVRLAIAALVLWLIASAGWTLPAQVVDPLMNGLAARSQSLIQFSYPVRLGPQAYPYAVVGWLGVFAVLLLTRETNRRLGSSWGTILRVFVWSGSLAAICPFLAFVAEWCLDLTALYGNTLIGQRAYDLSARAFGVLAVGSFLLSLSLGCRRHLGNEHGGAHAIAAMVIGWALASVAELLLLSV